MLMPSLAPLVMACLILKYFKRALSLLFDLAISSSPNDLLSIHCFFVDSSHQSSLFTFLCLALLVDLCFLFLDDGLSNFLKKSAAFDLLKLTLNSASKCKVFLL